MFGWPEVGFEEMIRRSPISPFLDNVGAADKPRTEHEGEISQPVASYEVMP
jgi:hypothetical protein